MPRSRAPFVSCLYKKFKETRSITCDVARKGTLEEVVLQEQSAEAGLWSHALASRVDASETRLARNSAYCM